MTRLIADASMLALLRSVKGMAEVCDDSGQIVGYFTPRTQAEDDLYRQAALRLDPQEIARRKAAESGQGSTTEEVLAPQNARKSLVRYTIRWLPIAEKELARLWVDAPDRSAVTDAANLIDRALRTDPSIKGEEFYGDRILVVLPLQVVFSVQPEDRVVEIVQVTHQ